MRIPVLGVECQCKAVDEEVLGAAIASPKIWEQKKKKRKKKKKKKKEKKKEKRKKK